MAEDLTHDRQLLVDVASRLYVQQLAGQASSDETCKQAALKALRCAEIFVEAVRERSPKPEPRAEVIKRR